MPEGALTAFQEMRRRGIWLPRDTITANILLDALSSNAAAAFATCVHVLDVHLSQGNVPYLKQC